jgi:DNA-binding NtrC family response regulator
MFRDWLGQLLRGLGFRGPLILCADDDDSVRALCVAALTRGGFDVDVASDGREALDKLKERAYDAVLLDLWMPHLHGSTVLSIVQREQPQLLDRMIVITGAPEAVLQDVKGKVAGVLRKPLAMESLVSAVRERTAALEH